MIRGMLKGLFRFAGPLGLVAALVWPAVWLLGGPALGESARRAAPEFSSDTWLNSEPLTLGALRGKVVLVDFWEYTCINCIRTFPHLRRWNRLYGPLGLVIIGVHTPEFDFARDPELVADAARRFKLTFPIAVDSDYSIWRAFRNQAWPADYLIDDTGRIAMVHVGEGEYASLERHIQALLKEAAPSISFNAKKFVIPADEPSFGGRCVRPTPETYLGFLRGHQIANPGGYQRLRRARYQMPEALGSDRFALEGSWIANPEYVRQVSSGGALSLRYRAKSVYMVAGADDGTRRLVYVTQDGKPLPEEARGVDIRQDDKGRTYLPLSSKRMYYLVNNVAFGDHTLKLVSAEPSVSLYSFTFGNNCESAFDRR